MINLYSANSIIPNYSWDPHCNWKTTKNSINNLS